MRYILLIVIASTTFAAQIPFQPIQGRDQSPLSTSTPRTLLDSWDLSTPPSVNATGNLVFATASTLLQHWGNTRYRNGHTIVPGIVPKNTLLYHGRGDGNIPDMPEWTATDPEHSYMFCGREVTLPPRKKNKNVGKLDAGCWHLTLVTNRPLSVLYFDGSSAAKMSDGSMDTQDIIAWGHVQPERFFLERERLANLCEWGSKFGVDGFVRMEMNFEVMLCDFTKGVDVVSFEQLVAYGRSEAGRPLPEPKPPSTPRTPRSSSQQINVIASGSWNNAYPGDRRFHIDYTRLVSFYDTSLVPSLVEVRFGKDRLKHRLQGISDVDLQAVMQRLENVMSQPDGYDSSTGSGIDWSTLFQVIIHRHAERLETVRYILGTDSIEEETRLKRVHTQVTSMIQPYILRSVEPPPKGTASSSNLTWASPIYKLCATSHTKLFMVSPSSVDLFTSSEKLLLQAVRETSREICRVLTSLWAEGVSAGLDDHVGQSALGLVPPSKSAMGGNSTELVQNWQADIDVLFKWLDWSVWVKCMPQCDYEEMCYLPTWPYFMRGDRAPRPGPGGPSPPPSDPDAPPHFWDFSKLSDEEKKDYEDPQPRCVRRVDPYDSQL